MTRDERREYMRLWRKNNPEKVREYHRRYRETHPHRPRKIKVTEEQKAKRHAYYLDHKEEYRLSDFI